MRFVAHTFMGAPREDHSDAHDPGFGLWAAPAVLVAIVIASGLLPMAVFGPFVDAAASATTGEVATTRDRALEAVTARKRERG